MKKKLGLRALALLLSLLMLGSLTGCGGDTALKETNELNFYDPTALKIYDYGITKVVTGIFNAKYPYIAVNSKNTAFDFSSIKLAAVDLPAEAGYELQEQYDRLSIDIMKGTADDLIFADTFYRYFDFVTPPDYQKMIRAGAFTDLLPLLKEELPDFDFSVFDEQLIDGKLYAVPLQRKPYYIYGLENNLKEWNFDLNETDDILTFLRKCAAWQDANEDNPNAPEVFTKLAWEYIYRNIFNIIGLDVVDYAAGEANFNTPELKEILELLFKLRSETEEYIYTELAGYVPTEAPKALFGAEWGAYDSLIIFTLGNNFYQDQSVLVPLLQLDGKAATSSQACYMVPITAENKLNAIRYIATYLQIMYTYDENNKQEFGFDYYFPYDQGEEAFESRLEDCKYTVFSSESYLETNRYMYENQGKVCYPSYWVHSLQSLFDSYMRGEMSIDELMADVQSRLEIYVSE